MKRPALAPMMLIALGACEAPLSTLDPASRTASEIAGLWWAMLITACLLLSLVMALALHALRGRRRQSPVSTRTFLIGGGLAMPAFVLLAALVAGLVIGERALPHDAPDIFEVEATASQWQWQFRYGDGSVSENVLYIPARRPVNVIVRSQDVIHSFWVPRLAGKIDAIPGQTNVIRLRADRAGRFAGACAEFCGTGHADMLFEAVALEDEALREALGSLETAP
ncbi:MAG: cytochrome c oxidase subunit II [Brevundimonas sp.]|jgi:cytochrome c oxidase subunit II|uniref:cytochrome c oxidase subunit II n=1 Tax=Brevundimonas sp. TaxID=1871086 RepID=UPI003919404D